MDWIIFGLVVLWLGVISWFDLRKNEIPHSLWVIIPLMGAVAYQVWLGGWRFALVALLVAAVSERERIAQILGWDEIGTIVSWIPIVFLGACLPMQLSPVATLAIIGFWIAWELKCWGGADAVAAITLILLYPEIGLILAFFMVHGVTTLGLMIGSLIKDDKVCLHRIPGLPLLLVTVILYRLAIFLT